MKRTLQTLAMMTAAAMVVLAGTAQAAQQEKLTLTAEASPDTAHINGSTGAATLLVSVTDPDGNPVTNLQQANFGVFAMAIPGVCGWSVTQSFSLKPGFYQIALSLPNLPQCHWVYGDYLGVVRLQQLPNQAGMMPFKFTINSDTAIQ